MLKYGQFSVAFESKIPPLVFQIKEPATVINPRLFKTRLQEQLKLLLPNLTSPAIVIGDKTRLCGYREYLPIVLETLLEAGAEKEHIKLFIAYGTHPQQSDEDCLRSYGSAYHEYSFIHHNCTDPDSFRNLGKTSRGTDVYLRRDIVEASFLLTFGAISHHYFAGYGGGRKLIFPGLGYKPAIYQNHGLFLDGAARKLAPGCQAGVLDGNPLAEDLFEVESFRQPDLAIHGILNSRGEVCDLLTGSGREVFRNACLFHGRNCEFKHSEQYDLVLASCGGYPKDINFIQAHKAVHNAAVFVRDGGHLILLAECRDGVGSQTFLPWLELESYEAAFQRLLEHYQGNGGTALAMMEKLKRIRISLVTEINDKESGIIGFNRISMDSARQLVGDSNRPVAIIPNASLLVKTNR